MGSITYGIDNAMFDFDNIGSSSFGLEQLGDRSNFLSYPAQFYTAFLDLQSL
jgi:hypothetical protein